MAHIHWNKVTWYSKLLAVIVIIAALAWAFYLGRLYEQVVIGAAYAPVATGALTPVTENVMNDVTFSCDAGKTIRAQFMENNIGQGSVALKLSDGRDLLLPQTISADGARYAKPDESFVFWNKGRGAFIEEGAPYATSGQKMTFDGCTIQS